MTCRAAIAILGDYLEEALDAEAARRLERHAAGCGECAVYPNTYEKTRALAALVIRVDMPEGTRVRVRERLHSLLRAT